MHIGDVFDVMAGLPDGDFDLICTSPPFWRQRAYLPSDHPDKAKEIGQEATPAEYIDVMLRLTAEWRRLLSPYGSLVVEMGDTMAGSGGAGGDYTENGDGFRPGQPKWRGSASGTGSPLPKSHCNIPELYRSALVYGDWPILTGNRHAAGQWIQRNDVVWCRPNPTPGDDGDKFRRATSDIMCFTLNPRRWWDGEAVREAASTDRSGPRTGEPKALNGSRQNVSTRDSDGTRPLYDWWDIAPVGYSGAHYAVWTPEIARRLILTMCPEWVCLSCGNALESVHDSRTLPGMREPDQLAMEARGGGRGITQNEVLFPDLLESVQRSQSPEHEGVDPRSQGIHPHTSEGSPYGEPRGLRDGASAGHGEPLGANAQSNGSCPSSEWDQGRQPHRELGTDAEGGSRPAHKGYHEADDPVSPLQRTDQGKRTCERCGSSDLRRGRVLDPFAGSGTTAAVATGHGRHCTLIDIDSRNAHLARERVGMFLEVPA
jgi:site-specific DNA-methyltransferase (cytosine-N4-specific)